LTFRKNYSTRDTILSREEERERGGMRLRERGRGRGREGAGGKLKKIARVGRDWNEEKEVSGCRKGTYGPVKWQFRNKLVSFQKSPG
jgi:hypothetical protein